MLNLKWSMIVACTMACGSLVFGADSWVTYEGKTGPGKGKHILLLAGDEEYRSEESMPMLARILAFRHGFKCTVLFSIDPRTGLIDPTVVTNIPGMHLLKGADLCVMALRWRELPDDQMEHLMDYLDSGKPFVALRTSTHPFAYKVNPQSKFARTHWASKEWPGGFGQQVFGETWVSHHGNHGKESTRGIINKDFASNPILRGVDDIWGPTDVYTVVHLPASAKVLVWGQVLTGMNPTDPPVAGKKNDPMMPLVWTMTYTGEKGKASKILTSTIGAAVDLESEGLRRLLVNGCYWAVGLEEQIPVKADVAFVGEYKPTWFGFGKFTKGIKPTDLAADR